MIIASEKMKEVYHQVLCCAKTNVEVLLLGESGTGKELLARVIHEKSNRASGPFVAINCGAIPEDLIENELFGHERGAFTSASERRKGKFEEASEGTIFLDEVAELPIGAQAALLRVLETKSFTRLGGNEVVHSNFRVITATNKNLYELVRKKRFREDLYWRLEVVTITLPPLRERIEDVRPLIDYFLEELGSESVKDMRISEGAIKKLLSYHYSGNVRELRSIIRRAAVMCGDGSIDEGHITYAPYSQIYEGVEDERPSKRIETHQTSGIETLLADPYYGSNGHLLPLKEAIRNFGRSYILKALQAHNWNISNTSKILGITRQGLQRKIRRYDLKRSPTATNRLH